MSCSASSPTHALRRFGVLIAAVALTAAAPSASNAGSTPPELVGIDHYAVNVADLQRSADWYERILGFHLLHRWQTTWMVGKGNIKVGLFLRPRAKPLPDIDSQYIIQHVAFLVDGDKFDDVVAGLKAEGVQMDPVEDTGIAYSVFLHDPDNNLLEITTYHPVPAPAPQPPAPK